MYVSIIPGLCTQSTFRALAALAHSADADRG
jgi:hypothetical protein